MKISLGLIFTTVFLLAYSQSRLVPAKIITINNDTLKLRIKVVANIFDPSYIYGTSVTTKIKTVNDDEKKKTIDASEIKELSFWDGTKDRTFINKYENKKFLTERLYNGNVLEWYRDYTEGVYAGDENSSDFLFNKATQKGIGIGYFTGLPKQKLKEFLGDEPEMNTFIETTKCSLLRKSANSYTVCLESIIKKYETLKSNKK